MKSGFVEERKKVESIIIPEFNNELRIMIFDNIINKMRIKFKDVDTGDFISRISMITLKWDEVIQIAASIIIPQSLTILSGFIFIYILWSKIWFNYNGIYILCFYIIISRMQILCKQTN